MPRINILIVEDDLTTQEMARMVLENAGYGVSVARSAEDAERILRNLWPDIVLMDRELPGMDGLEFTRQLKSAEETSSITVIAFSTSQTPADNELALAAGSDGFCHKPFTVRGLLQTIAWHVAARDSHPGPSLLTERHAVADRSPSSNPFGGFMKLFQSSTIVSGLLILAAATASGQHTSTATATVTFSISEVNQISVSAGPTLNIVAGTAGTGLTSVSSTGLTWAVTTNTTGAKVTAELDSDMPTGVTLDVSMGAPTGGTGSTKSLTQAAQDVVTGITQKAESGLSLGYTLSALPTAGAVTSTTRVVTYTVVGGV